MFHVYARGNNRGQLYLDRADRLIYLRLLRAVAEHVAWRCLAYCLMGNHVHLLLETPEPTLAKGMHRLHGAYARRHNARHGKTGHVFERRYGSVRVETDAQLWAAVRYVARNPVEAGLCRRPEDYAWSSFGGVVSGDADLVDVERLCSYFRAWGGDPLQRYRSLAA